MMAAAFTGAAKTLGDVLGPAAAGARAGLAITGLVLDSRQVAPGTAFIAVPGGREHGLDHAAEAFANGAAVMLYEPSPGYDLVPQPAVAVPGLRKRLGELARAFYADSIGSPVIVGVTGTNGKTTVAYLVAQAMAGPRRRCAYVGTLGFGVLPELTPHALTTPDCLTLHRELAALEASHVAMEVSSHALEQDRVAGLVFDTAVFTNLTRDHLDQHGDLQSYADAKARLFRRPELAHAVLNADDRYSQTLASAVGARADVLAVSAGGGRPADLTATIRRLDLGGIALDISGRFGAGRLESALLGEFNAENLALALGALLVQGVPLAQACRALESAAAPPGRMQLLGGSRGRPTVVIDYAHTPAALERVLVSLERLVRGEIWCVFGCGGERDRGKRTLMGAVAGRHADHVVLTDDNPRSEDPAVIVSEIRAGLEGHSSVRVEHDRSAAIDYAVQRARAADVVVVAGKGHETLQIVGTQARAFSDATAAADALGAQS